MINKTQQQKYDKFSYAFNNYQSTNPNKQNINDQQKSYEVERLIKGKYYSQQSCNNPSLHQLKENTQKKYAYINNSRQQHESTEKSQFKKGTQIQNTLKARKQQFSQSSTQRSCEENYLLNTYRQIDLSLNFRTPEEQIRYLKQQLSKQKLKFQQLQQTTIMNQMNILETITNLQQNLKEIKTQNNHLRNQLNSKSSKQQKHFSKKACQPAYQSLSMSNLIENLQYQLSSIKQEHQNLLIKYRKIKGIANGLKDMMKKVDGLQVPSEQNEVKFVWKWIKKLVWQYEGIRKKAFSWKQAYDQLYKIDNSDSEESDAEE